MESHSGESHCSSSLVGGESHCSSSLVKGDCERRLWSELGISFSSAIEDSLKPERDNKNIFLDAQ